MLSSVRAAKCTEFCPPQEKYLWAVVVPLLGRDGTKIGYGTFNGTFSMFFFCLFIRFFAFLFRSLCSLAFCCRILRKSASSLAPWTNWSLNFSENLASGWNIALRVRVVSVVAFLLIDFGTSAYPFGEMWRRACLSCLLMKCERVSSCRSGGCGRRPSCLDGWMVASAS